MQIEIQGQVALLEQLRLRLQDQLEQRGFVEGLKVGSMKSGLMIDYVKEESIISIQLTEESDSGESLLRVESEKEIPGLRDAWDDALISYGKELMAKLRDYALDKEKVDHGLR